MNRYLPLVSIILLMVASNTQTPVPIAINEVQELHLMPKELKQYQITIED